MQQEILFNTPQGEFLLHRFPQRKRELLRAWDAADELILDHVANEITIKDNAQILIINDSFGALTTALNGFNLTTWSDSYIAHQASRNNLKINHYDIDKVTFLSSLETPSAPVDLVLLKIPKTLALLEDQLIKLKPIITPDTQIIAGGMIKSLSRNVWKTFETLTGPTTTSLARKKARLIFIKPDNNIAPIENPYPVSYTLENTEYTIINHANVFSRDSLDIGTRFFLDHLPQENTYQDIIDLGCGNGILGIRMQQLQPEANLHFVDESYMAIASAKENYQAIIGSPSTAWFYTDDCLSSFSNKTADLILCNPPFHQHNTVSNHIALRMLRQAHQILRPGGALWLIGNRHLNYHHNLRKTFGNYSIVASNPKFIIYRSLV